MPKRGTLRLYSLAVGYLTRTSPLRDSEVEEDNASLGTVVAMNRNLLVTARNNVVDPVTGNLYDSLAVGFLRREPLAVDFVEWNALDIDDLVLLRLAGHKHLPYTLEIPELCGGRLLAGRRWLAIGYPKGVPYGHMFHLRGSIESAYLSTGYALLAELKSDTPLDQYWSAALEGAPLYAEDPSRGWPLAGFIVDPPVRRVDVKPGDLYGVAPESGQEETADELDLALAQLVDFQNRSSYRALSPDVRAQFLLDQLQSEFERYRSAPSKNEYRGARRADRRSSRTPPAREAGAGARRSLLQSSPAATQADEAIGDR